MTEIFGTKNLCPHEQVQQLLQVSNSELRAKVGRQIPLGPMVDGDMIHETTTYQALAGRSDFRRIFPGAGHCKRIIVGDCQMDVSHSANFLIYLAELIPQTRPRHLPPVSPLVPISCLIL